jgi:hypothetical protein
MVNLGPAALFRRQDLKIRVKCGSAACRDLCGGTEATPVPTATRDSLQPYLHNIFLPIQHGQKLLS